MLFVYSAGLWVLWCFVLISVRLDKKEMRIANLALQAEISSLFKCYMIRFPVFEFHEDIRSPWWLMRIVVVPGFTHTSQDFPPEQHCMAFLFLIHAVTTGIFCNASFSCSELVPVTSLTKAGEPFPPGSWVADETTFIFCCRHWWVPVQPVPERSHVHWWPQHLHLPVPAQLHWSSLWAR